MNEAGAAEEAPVRGTDWRMVLLGVLALLGTAVLVGLLNQQATTDRERDLALARQAATYETIIRAGQLSTAIAQAESALGRYVVSTDKEIGEALFTSPSTATTHVAHILNKLGAASRREAAAVAARDGLV